MASTSAILHQSPSHNDLFQSAKPILSPNLSGIFSSTLTSMLFQFEKRDSCLYDCTCRLPVSLSGQGQVPFCVLCRINAEECYSAKHPHKYDMVMLNIDCRPPCLGCGRPSTCTIGYHEFCIEVLNTWSNFDTTLNDVRDLGICLRTISEHFRTGVSRETITKRL